MTATANGSASAAFQVHSPSGLDRTDARHGCVVWDAPRSLWKIGMFGARPSRRAPA